LEGNITRQRRYALKKRAEVLEALGNQCVVCGITDPRVLQIDHVNGGGTQEHRKIKSRTIFLRKVLDDQEGLYQLLCANCNWIKRFENNENPTRKL